MRDSLGKLPDGFVSYWLTRFPLLLPHVWLQMQQYRDEDILQTYYPRTYVFNRDDVIELNNDKDCDYEVPSEMYDSERNHLFLKSRVYVDSSPDRRYKEGSPKKLQDWRSEAQEFRLRQDDIRLRDRHYYKKKERKKEEAPIWSLPPQWKFCAHVKNALELLLPFGSRVIYWWFWKWNITCNFVWNRI